MAPSGRQPVQKTQDDSSTMQACSRCSNQTTTYNLRKELFCSSCLQDWILTRLAKRVGEGFRIPGSGRNNSRRVLLPLSGGSASFSLLHLVTLHADARLAKTNRAGVEIIVLWVDQSTVVDDGGFTEHAWEKVKTRYGDRWQIAKIDIQDIFSDHGPLPEDEKRMLVNQLLSEGDIEHMDPLGALVSLLRGLPEPSSRTDLLTTLRTRLINAFAQRNTCSIVAWGDTTTRLAEKTLAETAKGRGFSLPWQTGDGETPFPDIKYIYPLQDLYRSEIDLWAKVSSNPSIEDVIPPRPAKIALTSASTRNLTIDNLMRQYFSSVEASYPSIVTNVVRTSNKLEAPRRSDRNLIDLVDCAVCGLSYDGRAGGLAEWEGNQKPSPDKQRDADVENESEVDDILEHRPGQLCYGCARTLNKTKSIVPVVNGVR